MTSSTSRANLDAGRLVMVPAALLMLVIDVHAQLAAAAATAGGVLRGFSAILVCAFYMLIIWSYLRRGPAVATTKSITASAVAILATFTPFAFPLLAGSAPAAARLPAAAALPVAVTTWSASSSARLRKAVALIAQARGV